MRKFLVTLFVFGIGSAFGTAVLPLLPGNVRSVVDDIQQEIRYSVGREERPVEETHSADGNPAIRMLRPTPTSTPDPSRPSEDAFEVEARFHALVNEARAANGLPRLALDPDLSDVARYHSQRMDALDFFDHDDPHSGTDPTARGLEFGYTCRKDYDTYYTEGLGENLWMVTGAGGFLGISPQTEAERAFDSLMDSPGHRANILDVSYDRQGIGVHVSDGAVWLTQNFC